MVHALSAEGADASEDGTGRGTPLVVANTIAATLSSGGHPNSNAPGRRKEDDVNLVGFNSGQGAHNDLACTDDGTPPITGRNGDPGAVLFPAGGIRRLTPLECERLQGFPDGWTEGESDSTRYRMLGNAVAVPVAEWIGRRIA